MFISLFGAKIHSICNKTRVKQPFICNETRVKKSIICNTTKVKPDLAEKTIDF